MQNKDWDRIVPGQISPPGTCDFFPIKLKTNHQKKEFFNFSFILCFSPSILFLILSNALPELAPKPTLMNWPFSNAICHVNAQLVPRSPLTKLESFHLREQTAGHMQNGPSNPLKMCRPTASTSGKVGRRGHSGTGRRCWCRGSQSFA